MTVGQRWRFRRNLVIAVAHREGFSQRMLADVFDLPRSRIAAIIAEVEVLVDRQSQSQAKPVRRGLYKVALSSFRKARSHRPDG